MTNIDPSEIVGLEFISLYEPTMVHSAKEYINDLCDHPQKLTKYPYQKKCASWFKNQFPESTLHFTASCTQSLEVASLLLDIQPGDEVILPSFIYVAPANAFAVRGAKLVFVDIDPVNMNIDPDKIEAAISDKTKAIVIMHYAGVACEMDRIVAIAKKHDIPIVEDAAHGVLASYNGKPLGSMGTISCFSFDQQKNLQCSEGGLIVLNDLRLKNKLEEIVENGTNRSAFYRREVKSYSWQRVGLKARASEFSMAVLWSQLEIAEQLTEKRLSLWNIYQQELQPLADAGHIRLNHFPEAKQHNAHIFFLKTKDATSRKELQQYLMSRMIESAFHYLPLHESEYGAESCTFAGEDHHTASESHSLLRLPLSNALEEEQVYRVCNEINKFYQ